MNMKLLTALSVAITLVSAMTFVNLYQKSGRASSTEDSVVTTSLQQYSTPFAPSPDVTEGSADVKASVKIGNPGDVSASVTIL